MVPRAGTGPALESAADLLIAGPLACASGFPDFAIVSPWFCLSVRADFCAAAFSSGVILAYAPLRAAASRFILPWSAPVVAGEVLSSANAAADTSASAPAIRTADALFLCILTSRRYRKKARAA